MKKLNIFLLSLLSIVLVVLLIPNAYASGLSAQYSLDLTIVYGEGPTDVHKPNLGPFNHGQNTELDLSALNGTGLVGNKSFAFYVVNGQIVESTNHQFKVTSNTKVTSVFTDGAEHAAVFVDSNGEFIAVDYVDGVTAPVAPNVATLSKPGYTPVAYGVLDPISEHTVYVVEYELTNPNAAVTINGVEYPYDSIVTLESTDENFTHWESNGVIVSYNPVYKFSALYDRTVEAKTSVVTETTVITLTDDLGFRSSEGKSSYLGQFDLKDGEVLIEAGIIGSEVYVNDLKLDTLGATIIPSSVINPTTGEFLRTIESNTFAVVRGYLVTDKGVYYSDPQVVLEEVEYNFYVTLGTLPTLYAGLAMFENEVESYAWYFRSGTFNTNYLPDYVNFFPNQGVGGANSPIDFRIIRDKIVELKAAKPHAKFNLFTDDLRTQLIFDLLISAGIDESRYSVTLLSDGTGTYNVFKQITSTEWVNMESNWNSYLDEYTSGTLFKWGYNTQAMELQKYSTYASMFDNVEYWLQFPEYMINSNSADLMNDVSLMNLIDKDPQTMYANLSAEKREQFDNAVLSSSSSSIEYYNSQFLNRDKEILIITGTNIAGLETNVPYIDQVIEDFGDTHYLYFKPHPSYPPNSDLLAYFAEYNITVLPHRTPMEAIMWMFPEVYVGGYNSSLYMSAEYGQTLFFLGNIGSPITDLRDFGHFDNVVYYTAGTMLSGTIQRDSEKTGGTEIVSSVTQNKITFGGTIGWSPGDGLNSESGNRIGVQINLPVGADISQTTVSINGIDQTGAITIENGNLIYKPIITAAGQVETIVVTWKPGHKQTFIIEVLEDTILEAEVGIN